MNIVVRPACLEADQELLNDTLRRHLNPVYDGFRFDWLYKRNPHGQARAWIAVDTANEAIVGMAGAFPRRMFVGDSDALGWVLGDFCIDYSYRSLGPAIQLQRACLAEVDSTAIAFCYDFPSTSMMAVYKRLCIRPFGQMVRLAKPLRVNRKIRSIIKTPIVSRAVSALGNAMLALCDRKTKRCEALTITLHEGYCGEEFSALSKEVGGRYGVCIQRTAEYLNWRYLSNPLYCIELVTARCHNKLLAYAIFTHSDEDATLLDVFGVDDSAIIGRLVKAIATLLRIRGFVTVSAPMLESHPWLELLQRLGFRAREVSPVVVYTSSYGHSTHRALKDAKWLLMQGDRDS